ncbi:MAG: hypothetical protein ACREPY_10605 [Rhodanobacteraceae bacterium]
MSVESGEPSGSAETGSEHASADATQWREALAAGTSLVAAVRRVATAVTALLATEARVLGASFGLVFMGGVALVAFAVSLWACVVALIGWGVAFATGSVGIALGVLVVLHLILVSAIWFWIKRAIRRASFPATRAELRSLGRELRRDVARFQYADTSSPEPPEPESKS